MTAYIKACKPVVTDQKPYLDHKADFYALMAEISTLV